MTNAKMQERSPYCIYDLKPPKGMPCSDLDPFDPRFLEEPHAGHAALRAAGPIVWLTKYNIAAVSRYEEVKEVLLNWRTFSSARGVGMEDLDLHERLRLPSVILETDPPEHTTARGILAKALAPGQLRKFEADVRAEVDSLLDRCTGEIDAVPRLAEALPMAVFPRLIGIQSEGTERLLAHADMMFNSFGPRNSLFHASVHSAAHCWVEGLGKLDKLTPGSLGLKVHELARDAGYDPDYASKLVRALLQAGLDTTINGIAATLFCLSRDESQWLELKANPQLAGSAFEEAVRVESPVQTFFRTVAQNIEFRGYELKMGHKILMFLGAANRDPQQFNEPHRFAIARPQNAHVGFGAGIHHCVGRMLARLEAESLLSRLIERVERIEPAGPPVRRLNNTVRGLRSLPLRLVPV
jgi:cytochrome P450